MKRCEIPVQVIDGDILRGELGNLFGYTREERMKQNRIVRVLAGYLNRNDISTIVAVVDAITERYAPADEGGFG